MTCENRCTGQCCRDFVLPYSPAELRQRARAHARFQRTGKWPGPASNKSPLLVRVGPTDVQVLTMVRWLGFTNKLDPATTQDGQTVTTSGKPVHRYTCKNFDGTNCMIYDTRPRMCRVYGVENTCEHKGCTLARPTFELSIAAERKTP